MSASPHAVPLSAIAIRLIELSSASADGLFYVARSESRASDLFDAVTGLSKSVAVYLFPPWDCLPYDRAPPSREAMGRRISVLQALKSHSGKPRLVITVPDAVLQRVPPVELLGEPIRI